MYSQSSISKKMIKIGFQTKVLSSLRSYKYFLHHWCYWAIKKGFIVSAYNSFQIDSEGK